MGIEYEDMRTMLCGLRKNTPSQESSLLILGDAYIHFSIESYVALAKEVGYELHQIPKEMDPYALGKSLGFGSVDTLDLNGKATITMDLQKDLPEDMHEKYDYLLDAGVLFWCYDPGAALRNIYRMVRPQGIFHHITGITGYFGRGYYNIHPRLFEDFYLINKCCHILASYRTKLQRPTLLSKIVRALLRQKKIAVSYNYSAGNIYLDKSTRDKISFSNKLNTPESNVLPNNVIGNLVFQKLSRGEPKGPVQLC